MWLEKDFFGITSHVPSLGVSWPSTLTQNSILSLQPLERNQIWPLWQWLLWRQLLRRWCSWHFSFVSVHNSLMYYHGHMKKNLSNFLFSIKTRISSHLKLWHARQRVKILAITTKSEASCHSNALRLSDESKQIVWIQ